MAANAQIQTLLEAEKEAGKIVAKARQYRIDRLKAARTEAIKEIEALKAQKNAEFAAFEKQFSGSSDDAFSKVNAETEEKLIVSNQAFQTNKEQVIQKLMSAIASVQAEIHPNVRFSN